MKFCVFQHVGFSQENVTCDWIHFAKICFTINRGICNTLTRAKNYFFLLIYIIVCHYVVICSFIFCIRCFFVITISRKWPLKTLSCTNIHAYTYLWHLLYICSFDLYRSFVSFMYCAVPFTCLWFNLSYSNFNHIFKTVSN